MKRTEYRLFAIGGLLLLTLVTECVGSALHIMKGLGFLWLPLAMLLFERIGVVTARMYLSHWRMAILVIFLIAGLLTPPDPWCCC